MSIMFTEAKKRANFEVPVNVNNGIEINSELPLPVT